MAKKRKIHVTEDDVVYMHGEATGGGSYFVTVSTPYHQGFTTDQSMPYNEKDRATNLKDIEFLIEAFNAQKRWLLSVKTWNEFYAEGEKV